MVPVGINVKVQKSPKPTAVIVAHAKLERDLKPIVTELKLYRDAENEFDGLW